MDDLTKRAIEARIDLIVRDFNYENRKEEHPEECPCNDSGKCHDVPDLNCFFCYCPWYNTEVPEGGCRIESPLGTGKWFYRPGHPVNDRIWDCSDCAYPHQEKVVRETLRKLFKGELNP